MLGRFLSAEGCQPAELGWGTHEKELPPLGARHEHGCGAAIYIERPGASTRVRTWTPMEGHFHGWLITHNEAISLADYFTIGTGDNPTYRPTVHYAYHPCDDAVLSVHELAGKNWVEQVGPPHPRPPPRMFCAGCWALLAVLRCPGGSKGAGAEVELCCIRGQERKKLIVDEIISGVDELGVLIMGTKPDSGARPPATSAALCDQLLAARLRCVAACPAGFVVGAAGAVVAVGGCSWHCRRHRCSRR